MARNTPPMRVREATGIPPPERWRGRKACPRTLDLMKALTAEPARGAVPLAAYGHLLVIYIVWGCTYLAVKICLTGDAALTVPQLQTARVWVSGALLAGLAWWRAGPLMRPSSRDLMLCFVSGALMWVVGNSVSAVAARHAASGFIIMALGAIPLWSSLLELIIARTLPGRRVILGLLLGAAGLFLVVAPALFDPTTPIIEPGYAGMTILLLMIAGISWSLGTIIQRPLNRTMRPEWAATLQMGAAALVLTPMMLAEGAPLPGVPGVDQLFGFGFLVVFASVIGLTSYIQVLRNFSPVVASTFAYVNPVVGVLLGWLLLGEVPEPLSIAGLAVVLASIAIVISRPR